MEGPAVVDPDHDRAAIVEVGDAGEAGQRQGLVGGGEGVHVVDLLAGGAAAVELLAVVRRQPFLGVAVRAVEHVVALAEHAVALVAGARTRFGAHLRLGDRVDVGDVVRHGVGLARAEQATGHVVAALAQVFLCSGVRRDLRPLQRRGGVHRLRRLHDEPRTIIAGLLRCGAGGRAGRQRERQCRQQERALVHGVAGARPAIDCDSW